MIEAHAGIQVGDDEPGAARGHVPGAHRVDRRGLRTLQDPLLVEQGVVGQRERIAALIELGVLDLRVGAQQCQRLLRRGGSRVPYAQQMDAGKDMPHLRDVEVVAGGERGDASGGGLVTAAAGYRAQLHQEAVAGRRRRSGRGGRRARRNGGARERNQEHRDQGRHAPAPQLHGRGRYRSVARDAKP